MELVKLNGGDTAYQELLARNMRRRLILSTTTQFVFARVAGASRTDCLKGLSSLGVRGWSFGSVARIGAAFILPRKLLRWCVVEAASRSHRKAMRQSPSLAN